MKNANQALGFFGTLMSGPASAQQVIGHHPLYGPIWHGSLRPATSTLRCFSTANHASNAAASHGAAGHSSSSGATATSSHRNCTQCAERCDDLGSSQALC